MTGFYLGWIYGMIAAGMADNGIPFWKSFFWPYTLGYFLAKKIRESAE